MRSYLRQITNSYSCHRLWRSYARLSATTYSLHNMLEMSIGQNARVQTFAQVVDSFVDHCLWQVAIK